METAANSLVGNWTAARATELLTLARTWRDSSGDVVIDCAGLERVDAATLQVLLALRRALAAAGRKLVLADVPPPVATAIRLGGLQPELLP